jgi:RNA 3'-terminal phosphate cyclase (ATP)
MITIDGSHGEGGGQLVRMSCALSALTGKPIRLNRVRARRAPPGLAPQHLAAVQAVAQLCNAETEGLALRTQEFTFIPDPIRGGEFRFDVGTAGSITLVLQAVLPVAIAAPAASTFHILGGTDVKAAPPFDYFRYVFLPLLQRLGLDARVTLVRRGYFPRGGGEVEVCVQPGTPSSLMLDTPGALQGLGGIAHIANLPAHIVERMQHTASEVLSEYGRTHIDTRQLGYAEAIGPGGAIVLWARLTNCLLGGAQVAQRGIPAERIAEQAAYALQAELRAAITIDVHAADQLLIYLALSGRPAHFTVRAYTSHAQTTAWLIEQFLPVRFTAKQIDNHTRIEVASC